MFRTKSRTHACKKPFVAWTVLAILVLCIVVWLVRSRSASSQPRTPITTTTSNRTPVVDDQKPTLDNFDTSRYSLEEPGSLWWIVNKQRPLPEGYVPDELVNPGVTLRLPAGNSQMLINTRVAKPLAELFSAAAQAGHSLVFASGYRSYQYQSQLYTSYVQRSGQDAADRFSARPGTSEHQTGLALDICLASTGCELEEAFADTAAGTWVAQHAHEFGFIVRYMKGKEAITGYQYEPWHLRYVGNELAAELYRKQLTMEEFFEL